MACYGWRNLGGCPCRRRGMRIPIDPAFADHPPQESRASGSKRVSGHHSVRNEGCQRKLVVSQKGSVIRLDPFLYQFDRFSAILQVIGYNIQ